MQSVLNEDTIVGTIAKLFLGADYNDKNVKNSPYLTGSIAKYSKKMMMSFPLLCDAGVPVDTAMMVSKANERNIVAMLQILFASLNLQTKDGSGADVIASLYQDLDPNMTYNDLLAALDRLSGAEGNMSYYGKINESDIRELMTQFKNQKPFRKESLNEQSVSDFIVGNINGNTIVAEAARKGKDRNKTAPAEGTTKQTPETSKNITLKDKVVHTNNSNYTGSPETSKEVDREGTYNRDLVTHQLGQQDAKKANDAEPTMMVINYNVLGPDGNHVIEKKSFLAGIKSRLIPVDSMDIIDRFVSKDRTKISLKNLIRATTGEISFWKDFLLCLDKVKMDARNSAKTGPMAQIWNILEKRSIKNNTNKLRRTGNDGSAITTVCLSSETVNFMRNSYNFDIELVSNAKMIMESYNLLGLIITDEATESVKIMYDGNNEFEVLAYNALENYNRDRDFKNSVNLINRQGR